MKTKLLLGNMTFHHFSDEENEKYFGGKDQVESESNRRCLVHELHEIIECENADEAGEKGEELLDNHESYLIPNVFGGRIAFERDKDKELFYTTNQ